MVNNTICYDEVSKCLENRFVNCRQLSQFTMRCINGNEGRVLIVALCKNGACVTTAMINFDDEGLQALTKNGAHAPFFVAF